MGSKYLNENKYREAVIQFKNAVAIDPRYAEARYQLGVCYLKLGQSSQAYQEFVKTADLDKVVGLRRGGWVDLGI